MSNASPWASLFRSFPEKRSIDKQSAWPWMPLWISLSIELKVYTLFIERRREDRGPSIADSFFQWIARWVWALPDFFPFLESKKGNDDAYYLHEKILSTLRKKKPGLDNAFKFLIIISKISAPSSTKSHANPIFFVLASLAHYTKPLQEWSDSSVLLSSITKNHCFASVRSGNKGLDGWRGNLLRQFLWVNWHTGTASS